MDKKNTFKQVYSFNNVAFTGNKYIQLMIYSLKKLVLIIAFIVCFGCFKGF